MRAKNVIVAVVAFACGFAVNATLSALAPGRTPSSIAQHWTVVNDYNAYIRDPENAVPSAGFLVVSPPSDPDPSLAALVAAGELVHVDLVFPDVPATRTSIGHWMQWADKHEHVVYASGNPEYVAFKPAGTPPLHLNLWFHEIATPDVQQLIADLERLAHNGS